MFRNIVIRTARLSAGTGKIINFAALHHVKDRALHSGVIPGVRLISTTKKINSVIATPANIIIKDESNIHPNLQSQSLTTQNKKTLVILGSGWGAVSLVRSIDPQNYNIIVISPRNFFLFTPLLPSTTTGSVEYNSITESITGILRTKTAKSSKPNGIMYYEAAAKKIDYDNKSITIENTLNHELQSVSFDYLVLAVGAATSTFNIPGVQEHAFFLKEISDSRKIRSKVVDWINTREDKSLHAVVVGGGPTGVEVAAELQDLYQEDLKKKIPSIDGKFTVSLVEAMPTILNSFDKKLRKFAELQLQKDNINLLTSTAVQRVTDSIIYAKTKKQLSNGSIVESSIEIPYDLIIWATGITSHTVIQEFMSTIETQKASKRGVLIDDNLSVKGINNVWAIGDCTSSKNAATAQVAHQQGIYLGNLFNQVSTSNVTPSTIAPFQYSHKGSLAYVGGNRAVADLKLWSDGKLSTRGYLTYWVWRFAYLSMFVPAQNRFLVATDWFRVKLFGRNISSM